MACFGVLLLPMDVANRNSAFQDALRSNGVWAGESLPMTGIWEVVLMSIVVMVLGIIPFAIFYYEESGEGCAASAPPAARASSSRAREAPPARPPARQTPKRALLCD